MKLSNVNEKGLENSKNFQKKLWVNVTKWDKKIVTTALESNADALLVPKGYTKN